MEKAHTQSLMLPILTLTFCRLMINITRRFPYPFLPAISRQLEVPLSSVQTVMATQAGVGMASPFLGSLSEQFGRKRVMMAAILWMVAASVFGALFPRFWVFAVVMIAYGIGKMIFDPVMQAYLGDTIPYHRRGLALGTTELSWAGSLIIAAPVAGLLLGASGAVLVAESLTESLSVTSITALLRDEAGIQRIFAAIAVVMLLAFAVLTLMLPADHPQRGTTRRMITPLMSWRILRHHPAALAALAYSFLFTSANEMFLINYGVWMEVSFELALAALGVATIVIAVAEVLGEFIVIFIADRVGKRRLALLGALGCSVGYSVLPGLSFSLPAVLVGLFVLFVFVETAIVSSIPLFTEILPNARAVMMSSNVGSHAFGRLAGAVMGGLLYSLTGSFVAIGVVSTVVGLTAVVLLWRLVHE